MQRILVGVGDRNAQQRFIKAHQEFLHEHPALHELLKKVSLRKLELPPLEERKRLMQLPEDDPARIAFEDKMSADLTVFALGRILPDDFGELLVLAGNGYGIGAQKILRGIYERLVTAAFLAKNPSEARPFAENIVVEKWKIWKRYIEVFPDLEETVPKEEVDALEAEYSRVKAKHKESTCNKCGQPKTQEAWTRVDLATMAKQAYPSMADLYAFC